MTENKAHLKSISNQQTVKTTLGEVTVDTQKPLHFPNGIAGFPKADTLYIADLPTSYTSEYTNLRILQSLDNTEISLLVTPVSMDSTIYDLDDIEQVCQMLDINTDHISLFLIVSSHYSNEKETMNLTANTRAPIIVNTDNNHAYQYIFTHIKYPIQHEL